VDFVNAHTHIYSGLAPFGMPAPTEPPRNFVQILERIWWKLDRALDARALQVSARWYVADALRLGTVGLVDHHESPDFIDGSLDVLADVCQELGMPATFKLRELGVLRARDMPAVEVILVEEPEPEGPLGAKGVGEIGLVPTAAAVASALEAFDGIRRTTLPMKDSPAARAMSVGRPRSRTTE
jgi:hypothetical protein